MEVICYFCNQVTNAWAQDFTQFKSQHSKTPISVLTQKFLGNFESSRNVDEESNCICSDCLNRVNEYDLTAQMAIEQERELRELLVSTELSLILKTDEDYHNGSVSENDANELMENDPTDTNSEPKAESEQLDANDEQFEDDIEKLEQHEMSLSPESITTIPDKPLPARPIHKPGASSIAPPETGKVVFIRRGEKLQKVRLIPQKKSDSRPVDSLKLTLHKLPYGTIMRGSDGTIYRMMKPDTPKQEPVPIVEKTPISRDPSKKNSRFRPTKCDLCDLDKYFRTKRTYEVRKSRL